jgi:threonine/homoserine/homoserine lactone efflux protein
VPDFSTLLTFIAAVFVLDITPGPDMMLVLARGVGQGRKIALLTVVGMVFVAGIIQLSLLVLGLASLMRAYPASLVVLKWAGALYLLYLGARTLWSSRKPPEERKVVGAVGTNWTAVREGCINNLTNPKSLLFMFAFLPQFISPQAGPVWSQLIILGTIQKLAGVLSLGSVAVASGTVGQWLRRWPRLLVWQERFTGLVMVALGLRLALTGSVSRH